MSADSNVGSIHGGHGEIAHAGFVGLFEVVGCLWDGAISQCRAGRGRVTARIDMIDAVGRVASVWICRFGPQAGPWRLATVLTDGGILAARPRQRWYQV